MTETIETRRVLEGVASEAQTFEALNMRDRRPGDWFELAEAEYWYFLEVLPPLAMTRGSFAMCEFYDRNWTQTFHQIGDRYFSMLTAWHGEASMHEARRAIKEGAGA